MQVLQWGETGRLRNGVRDRDEVITAAEREREGDCHHGVYCLTSIEAAPGRSRASCWEKCICFVSPLHPSPATLWMSSPTEQNRLQVVMETEAEPQWKQRQVVTVAWLSCRVLWCALYWPLKASARALGVQLKDERRNNLTLDVKKNKTFFW